MSCPAAKSFPGMTTDENGVKRCPAGLVAAHAEECCYVCGGCSSCCDCTPEELGEADEIVDETDYPDERDDRDDSPIEWSEATAERWDFDSDPDWR